MTVSVIIPNYNHAKYLKQRIDSVINQTYRDFEIIILDDCSTDNSREIIDNYTYRFPYVKSYYNASNSGNPFKQWDTGVNKAEGELIWIAESDDFADPGFLEKTSEILLTNKNIGLVYCDSEVIDNQGSTGTCTSDWKKAFNSGKWKKDYLNNGKNEVSDFLYQGNTINNVSSVLFRKQKYVEAGFADHSMKFCGDWYLYIRILLISDIAYISEPLNALRIHADSSIHRYFGNNRYLKEVIRVYSFIGKHNILTLKKKLVMIRNLLSIIKKRVLFSIGFSRRQDAILP